MKIMLLNGSPKADGSASAIILSAVQKKLAESNEFICLSAINTNKQELMERIQGCHTMVIAFPLYVDGIPSHLLRLLDDISGDIKDASPQIMVYAIVNNGFYEGRQNNLALEMVRNFCSLAGLKWGQGLGVGAGGMINSAPIGRGPMKNLGLALDSLAEHIKNCASADNFYIEPNFPRFLYKIGGDYGWKKLAKNSGLKPQELLSRR